MKIQSEGLIPKEASLIGTVNNEELYQLELKYNYFKYVSLNIQSERNRYFRIGYTEEEVGNLFSSKQEFREKYENAMNDYLSVLASIFKTFHVDWETRHNTMIDLKTGKFYRFDLKSDTSLLN